MTSNPKLPWMASYSVRVVPNEHFPEGKMIETQVAHTTFQLYPHEARHLRDLLTAALGPADETKESR